MVESESMIGFRNFEKISSFEKTLGKRYLEK